MWLAHCDYLRVLQRLGHETLAHHYEHTPAPRLALASFVAGLDKGSALDKTAALVGLRGPVCAHALPPFMVKR